jgi:hypothetical protein
MKKSISLFMILALFATLTFGGEKENSGLVRVISSKHYLFYFEVNKKLIGGTIDVVSEDQEVIGTQTIVHAKTVVDFFNLRSGKYTIVISKGDKRFEFPYTNKE